MEQPILAWIKHWLIAIVVLIVSIIGILFTYFVYRHIHVSERHFWADWGTQIGWIYSVGIAIIVASVPSHVESRVIQLADRMQSPLSDFPSIAERAVRLLEELRAGSDTEFLYTSATPVLGIDLPPSFQHRWERALLERMEAGAKTSIVCLNPSATPDEPLSPLGEFCRVLAKEYIKDPAQEKLLWERSFQLVNDFSAKKLPNFEISVGPQPPYQIVLARDAEGHEKGILYFSTSATLSKNMTPSGFYTEDPKMCEVIGRLYGFVSASARKNIDDQRSPKQKLRDAELQAFRKEKNSDYQIIIPELNNFPLFVKCDVFPPEIALAKKGFFNAIGEAVKKVWNGVESGRRVGVDVGSGTGLLALYLSMHASRVIATDLGKREYENTRDNAAAFCAKGNSAARITSHHTDLLENITIDVPRGVPLIVFNHPYYPSPSNTFRVGGEEAGKSIIKRFLDQARPWIENGGGIVMPYAAMAGEHNALEIATQMGLSPTVLDKATSDKYGDHTIYLFQSPRGAAVKPRRR